METIPPNWLEKKKKVQQKTDINDTDRLTTPCSLVLRRLTIEQLKLIDEAPAAKQNTQSSLRMDNLGVATHCRADRLTMPCHVVLWRLPIEKLKLIKLFPTAAAPIENTVSKETVTPIASEICTKKVRQKGQMMKTNDSVGGGPLRPKTKADADNKQHQNLPPKITRSESKSKQTIAITKNKSVRNKENQ